MQTQPKSIVVLTGAGISAESGLKTFRDNDGLWEGHKVEEVATPEAFYTHPELVHHFYNMRRAQLLEMAKPNLAHRTLAEFERGFSGDFVVVTQNVDNLHEQAGSKNIIHMHGELLKVRCQMCGEIFSIDPSDPNYNSRIPHALSTQLHCPSCHESNSLRPHIVWFGEMPLSMNKIEQALINCDLFVSIGTSGNVYPAAGFVEIALHSGARCVELNLEKSLQGNMFSESYYGNATQIVPEFFATCMDDPTPPEVNV